MVVVEDQEQVCPALPEAQLQYVLSLDDTYRPYTRFIAALLIPRASYASFFQDLRCFRCQPLVISKLSLCDRSNATISKDTIKHTYREVTTLFLQSRWSHPWCRKVGGNQDTTVRSKGWWSAEWTSTGRRMDKKEKEAEDRLHQLLLPLWVIMRGRMFPGDEIVAKWWTSKQEEAERHRHQQEMGFDQGVTVWLEKLNMSPSIEEIHIDDTSDSDSDGLSDDTQVPSSVSNNPFRKGGDQVLRPVKTTPNMREAFWNSAEAEQMQEDLKSKKREEAQAATSAFRLVATGMLLSTVPKWKLKRLLKKSQS